MTFIPNAGQIDPRVRYTARAPGRAFYFTPEEAVFVFYEITGKIETPDGAVSASERIQSVALALRFIGSRPDVAVEARDEALTKVSFFTGNDPEKWRAGLTTYRDVVYRDLWPRIDLVFQGAEGKLKSEFVVAPGAPVDSIRLAYAGAERVSLDDAGSLRVETALGVLSEEPPTSYQEVDGERVAVSSSFVVADTWQIGFAIGAYDVTLPIRFTPTPTRARMGANRI